jgi:hypothetical protein
VQGQKKECASPEDTEHGGELDQLFFPFSTKLDGEPKKVALSELFLL